MSELVKYEAPTEKELIHLFEEDMWVQAMSKNPPMEWCRQNSQANNAWYLPIDKVEFLLDKFFKDNYKIEVIKTDRIMNTIEVTVRVHYQDKVTGDWRFHDGVGAKQIQTAKGTGNLEPDMNNMVHGAIEKALPHAKSQAIKDACHHIGNVFGRNLNRENTLTYTGDDRISNKLAKQVINAIDQAESQDQIDAILDDCPKSIEKIVKKELQERNAKN
jgi:hypothetical protein